MIAGCERRCEAAKCSSETQTALQVRMIDFPVCMLVLIQLGSRKIANCAVTAGASHEGPSRGSSILEVLARVDRPRCKAASRELQRITTCSAGPARTLRHLSRTQDGAPCLMTVRHSHCFLLQPRLIILRRANISMIEVTSCRSISAQGPFIRAAAFS